MFDELIRYFNEEKTESIWFIIIGVISLLFSVWLFIRFKEGFYRGLIIPVVLISLIQITVGTTVYLRSDKQIEETISSLKTDKDLAKTIETARMDEVMKNFKIYKWIEIVFILSGVFLLTVVKERFFWMGVGAGLLIEGTFMIVLDVIAEMRGIAYLEWLNRF